MTARLPDDAALIGSIVRLDPTVPTDAEGLFAALDHESVWISGYGGGLAGRAQDPSYWADGIPDPTDRRQYTVRLSADSGLGAAGTIVGTTSLGDFSLLDERTHLGWTAYDPALWGTPVNPATKLVVLSHVFDELRFGRVKIQCDNRNERSAAAIAKLGATREGVLRRHVRRADGSFRDTIVFSVILDDWPAVAAGLRARID
ncbi:GNAT family protein [Nakamurella sp. A5-74]|uniref:GNAT family protein n=1 Tax=Nakamurella sp. A5-74 TaxID=3158264 RepID=A0AAU8DLC6_9ACTN